MKGKVIVALLLSIAVALPVPGGQLNTGRLDWTGSTELMEVSRDNARSGRNSLLFDTTEDKSPTSRMASAPVGNDMEGILEGWLLDDPVVQPVWITFGSEMSNCMGVQFGNRVNYLLRVGGADNVNTQIPRIEGWVGFRLEFTGAKVVYHLSLDDGETWEEVGESKAYKTFKTVHLRNNENTGASKMAAYIDDIRVMDSRGQTVLFEGFGGDNDPLSVSAKDKLPYVWGQIKASR